MKVRNLLSLPALRFLGFCNVLHISCAYPSHPYLWSVAIVRYMIVRCWFCNSIRGEDVGFAYSTSSEATSRIAKPTYNYVEILVSQLLL